VTVSVYGPQHEKSAGDDLPPKALGNGSTVRKQREEQPASVSVYGPQEPAPQPYPQMGTTPQRKEQQ
jgi:hypothetical protein